MTAKLTPKQKAFVGKYCSNGFNGTQAAISAGYSERSAREIASTMLTKHNIMAEINKFKESVAKKNEITVDSLVAELEEARGIALALETPQTSAAISATMGKAKLAGLDKQVLDHTSSDGSMSPRSLNDFYGKP